MTRTQEQPTALTVPPSPGLIAELHASYDSLLRSGQITPGTTFDQFFSFWSSGRRGPEHLGLDDGRPQSASGGPDLIDRPAKEFGKGQPVRTIVLLVDFPDLPNTGQRPRSVYERMLFGEPGQFLTGSMREYYRSVSRYETNVRGIDVVGEVYGWFRLPQPSTFYTNNNSGMGSDPQNAQGMARDAVMLAKAHGVDFTGYDVFNSSTVTALFIVHAGRGAEETGRRDHIWSMKWTIPRSVDVGGGVIADTFLTVPEDCKMGVCAHEWGHLAAQWADYYDTDRDPNTRSKGLGNYCLMAGGSWGNGGLTPIFPSGMLRTFHDGWVECTDLESSREGIELRAVSEGGSVLKIRNPKVMHDAEYVLVEYRRQKGQDKYLPDEGIAIYVVDESIKNINEEQRLAVELMQADGRRDLARLARFGNGGDPNDLYPFGNNMSIGETTVPPLHLPGGTWTGITIRINGPAGLDTMSVDVEVHPDATRD